MSEWECPLCGGPVESLGMLGNRQHGRCRNCGIDQSHRCTCDDHCEGPCPVHPNMDSPRLAGESK